jgi:predicted CopG family antitoxin
MGTYMVSYNISIKDEAYRFLKSIKGKDESFSDVILDFRKKKRKFDGKELLKFAGVLKDVDWEKRKKEMKKLRKSANKRFEGTVKYMEESRKKK